MSEVCFKEFKGWCKSFTKTEIYLSLLQVLFLIVLIAFLTFLILHFLACLRDKHEIVNGMTTNGATNQPNYSPINIHPDDATKKPTQSSFKPSPPTHPSTLRNRIECTWTRTSYKKTDAVTHYYQGGQVMTVPSTMKDKLGFKYGKLSSETFQSDTTNGFLNFNSDVDIVDDDMKNFLLALVKIRPPRDILFGCTLTVISRHWTLSAASCVEAIEEIDALDSFVMMEGFGEEPQGETHELSHVIMHPEYRGVNVTYDLVAIKSDDVLVKDGSPTVTLPTLLDNSLITLGERLGVLGFGKFSAETDPLDQRVREVSVYKLVRSQCRGVDTWAARHLVGGRAASRGEAGEARGLCAGRAGAGAEAGAACPCGGAPLLRGGTLLGVMSDDGACGLSCRPALYVDLALRRDWLDSVLQDD